MGAKVYQYPILRYFATAFCFRGILNPLIVQSLFAPFQLSGSRAFGVRASLGEGNTLSEGILLQEPVHAVVLEQVVKFSCRHGIFGKAEEVGRAGNQSECFRG